MYNKEVEFYDFTIKVFKYLNGRVNTFNRNCLLEIDLWTDYTLRDINIAGDYSYPALITVYLRAIIENITNYNIGNDEEWIDHAIRCSIIGVITHELLHVDQNYDIFRYTIDPEYAYNIEKDVILSSRSFVENNISELSYAFDFDVQVTDYPHPSYKTETNCYFRLNNMRDAYAKFISSALVFLGAKKDDQKTYNTVMELKDSIMQWVDEYDNVILYTNAASIVIKYNGVFPSDIETFNLFVYNNIFRWHRYIDLNIEESYINVSDTLVPNDTIFLSIKVSNRIDTIAPAYNDGH